MTVLGTLLSLRLERLRAVCNADASSVADEVARAPGAQCIGTPTRAQCNSGSRLRIRVGAL